MDGGVSSNGERQLLVVKVLCGNVCEMGLKTNKKLKRPPPSSSLDPCTGEPLLFDSVRGGPHFSSSGKSAMIVTYESSQALPWYAMHI